MMATHPPPAPVVTPAPRGVQAEATRCQIAWHPLAWYERRKHLPLLGRASSSCKAAPMTRFPCQGTSVLTDTTAATGARVAT